ncbi:MAG: hypothetical protein EOL88_08970 [Bacteroidia bacterium]|nr:hypothetical protein [Bacteroidia bacterium]
MFQKIFLYGILSLLFLWGKAQTPEADTAILLHGVEIEAPSEHPYARPVNLITRSELEQIPSTDPGKILTTIPNVSGVRKGPAILDPVVRGFRSGQLNVQLNGGMLIEGGCPNRMDPTSSHIAPEQLQTIQVLKGPFALRYGPNMGGVVRMLTKKPAFASTPGFNARLTQRFENNWPGNSEAIEAGYATQHFSGNLHAGQSKYGNYTSGSGESINSAYNKYHYGAAIALQNNTKHTLTLSADGSHGFNVHYPALSMDERTDDTYFSLLEYSIVQKNKPIEKLSVSLWHSTVHHVMDNKERPFSDTTVAISDIHTSAQGYRIEAASTIKGIKAYLGSDGFYITKDGQRIKTMILQPPVNGEIPDKAEALWNNANTLNAGIFTELSKRNADWFWMLAARFDYNYAASGDILVMRPGTPEPYAVTAENTISNFLNWSTSAGITRFFNHDLSLGLSLGRAMRSPDMTERFIIMLPVGYDAFDYLGNPALLPEINYEADLTINKQGPKGDKLSGGVFFSYVKNYITANRIPEKPLTADVLGVKQFINGEAAFLRGFEATFCTHKNRLIGVNWYAAITFGTIRNAEQTLINSYGQVTGTTRLTTDALPEIPPFETTLNLSVPQRIKNFTPILSLRYVAAQKHISRAYYEQETPGFLLINLFARLKPTKEITINAGVNNLLDTGYYEHLNRRVIGSTVNLPEPGRVLFVQIIFNWK